MTTLALSRIGCTCWATEEFNVPTTPTTWGSEASLLATWAPTSGFAVSSSGTNSIVHPLTALLSLACLTARSAPFLRPSPRADRSPDSGAISPILTVLPSPVPPPVPSSCRLPQPASARAPARTRAASFHSERYRTNPPFACRRRRVRAPGAAGRDKGGGQDGG